MPVLVGAVVRAGGKGDGTGACRLSVAGDRGGRRRTVMRPGVRRDGLSWTSPPPAMDFLPVPPIGPLSTRRLRDNKKPPETFPVDRRDPSRPQRDLQTRPRAPTDNPSGESDRAPMYLVRWPGCCAPSWSTTMRCSPGRSRCCSGESPVSSSSRPFRRARRPWPDAEWRPRTWSSWTWTLQVSTASGHPADPRGLSEH
jgi:hypothetical protein